MSGLGIRNFLGSNPGGNRNRGSFLNWKDKGEATVWLHTQGQILYAYQHSFMIEDEVDDKEKEGRKKQILRFPRFVSPESPEMLSKQFFRDRTTDRLEIVPTIDPFLILREWLRTQVRAGAIASDEIVFEWRDPKNSKIIQWQAGLLSKLVKGGFNEWNVNLDAKLAYTMLVVDANDVGSGVQIAQETLGLGDKLRATIMKEIESRGEEQGDPTQTPYAFKWKFDKKASNPNNVYDCFRYERAECTDQVWKLIAETEAQDLSRLVTPQAGDMEKIRAAFEAAQKIALPLDAIFSDDEDERTAAVFGRIGAAPARTTPSTQARGPAAPAVPATTGARRPGTQQPAQGAPPARTTAAPAATRTAPAATAAAPAARTRTRTRVEPTPPPEPEVEMLPCEECQTPMLPTATVCPGCGATYDVTEDEAPAPTPAPTPKPAARAAAPAATGPKRPTRPGPATSAPAATDGPTCWACTSTDIVDGVCQACGMEQGQTQTQADGDDDIPF